MSKEHFVPAQPGYRAWSIFKEADQAYASFVGEVVAWRMKIADDSADGSAFVAVPVTIYSEDVGVVEHGGLVQHESCTWTSFAAWLRDAGAVVCKTDAHRAREWYGIGKDLTEGARDAA